MARSVERPNRYFTFLRRLRAEGRSNMYGAIPYLASAFGIDRNESFRIICEWIDSQETLAAEVPVRKAVAPIQPADAPTLFDPPAPPAGLVPAPAPRRRRPVKARAAQPKKPRKPSGSRAA
jgi:hypothetical protein